jgi:citronellol/citronellal dehydrogenase
VGINALWPRTVILTAAIQMLGEQVKPDMCRKPDIVADAAMVILQQEAASHTGNFYIDEQVLNAQGISDFSSYAINPHSPLLTDLFLDDSLRI